MMRETLTMSIVTQIPSIEQQSGRFQFHVPSIQKGGGKRGNVNIFSEQSRRRLCSCFASLDWQYYGDFEVPFHFLTFTTPEEYWKQKKNVYVAYRKVQKKLENLIGYEGGMRRVELGDLHGMLHYHVLIVGPEVVSQSYLREIWTKALGYVAPEGKQSEVIVDVEKVKSAEDIIKYLGKYCAKAAYEGRETGKSDVQEPSFQSCAPPGPCSSHIMYQEQEPYKNYTGGRWWATFGNLRFAIKKVALDSKLFDVKDIAYRVRRLFKKGYLARLRKRVEYKILKEFSRVYFNKGKKAHISEGMIQTVKEKLIDSNKENQIEMEKMIKKRVKSIMKKKGRFLKGRGGFVLFENPSLITNYLRFVVGECYNEEDTTNMLIA